MLNLKRFKGDINMCSRPLLGKIIMFSLPLVFTGILQLLYNAADIIVVGRFASAHAMAAVGSTGALVNLVTNLFIGLSVGALAAMAKAIGANDRDSAERIVHTSILLSVIGGVVLGLVGYFMSRYFLIWMGTPTEILDLSTQYLKIFFIGMPVNLLYNFGASILRACGDTKNPLLFLTIAGLVNVGLNLLFVIVFKMGVAGVAWATIISQAISAVLIVICLIRRKGYGKLRLKCLRISKRAMIAIFKIGLPAGIQSTIFSFSNVIIQSSINSMGALAVAGNAAAANIEGFVYTSMNAISQACLTFTGQNFGAKNRENCRVIAIQTTIITTILGLVMGLTVFLAGTPLLKLYNTDPEVVAYGLERIKIVCLTYFACGLMEVMVGALRGIGKSTLPMIVSIVGVVGVRILWIFTVFAKTQNLLLLYWSYPISWVITTAIHFICLVVVEKKVFGGKMPKKVKGQQLAVAVADGGITSEDAMGGTIVAADMQDTISANSVFDNAMSGDGSAVNLQYETNAIGVDDGVISEININSIVGIVSSEISTSNVVGNVPIEIKNYVQEEDKLIIAIEEYNIMSDDEDKIKKDEEDTKADKEDKIKKDEEDTKADKEDKIKKDEEDTKADDV